MQQAFLPGADPYSRLAGSRGQAEIMRSVKTGIQAALGIVASGVMAVGAWAAGPFTVEGIAIDAKAQTTFEAQRVALEEGQTLAARKLIERLTLPEDLFAANFQPLTPEIATSLIAGLQISDEQRSATRYRGMLSLSFDPRSVRNYLTGLGIPFVQARSDPVAVIAVTELVTGEPMLGGDWAQAWAEGGFDNALTPVVAVDANLVALDAVLNLDESVLRIVMGVVGVDELMIVRAREGVRSTWTSGVVVRFDEEDRLVRKPITSVLVAGGFDAAAHRLVRDRQDAWKRANVVRNAERSELRVSVLFDTLNEWRTLQQAVAGASLVESARLDALSRAGAEMTLTHRGAREQVMSELSARGAILVEDDDLGWTVRRRQ